jgi:hypothetical protein
MNKLQLCAAVLIFGIAGIATASVPIIKISATESPHPDSFSQKNQPVSVAENSSAKAEAGSFNAVSSDHLAGMIGTNLSAMKSAYHKTAANVPALPMPETGMLGLLVIGFVALQSIGRKEKAGATKLQ